VKLWLFSSFFHEYLPAAVWEVTVMILPNCREEFGSLWLLSCEKLDVNVSIPQ
jgi:hypothetical protein